MNLELRHLRVVCAIAETGSVTKAASTLGLAQPALTAQLQRIERTLGGPLFERDRRGARPTALGELVLARARVLLPAMKGLQDEAARLAGAGDDAAPLPVRRGEQPDPRPAGAPARRRRSRTPRSPRTPPGRSTSWPSWSLAGRLDFALAGVCGDASPSAELGLSWREVGRRPGAGAAAGEPPARRARDEVDLADLRHEQWVAAPGDGCFGDCFAAACARAGFTPRKVYETDIRGCVDLVDAGVAVALCQATFRPVAGLVTRRSPGRRCAGGCCWAGTGLPRRPGRRTGAGDGGGGVHRLAGAAPGIPGLAAAQPGFGVGAQRADRAEPVPAGGVRTP